jgi:hypothetical protein
MVARPGRSYRLNEAGEKQKGAAMKTGKKEDDLDPETEKKETEYFSGSSYPLIPPGIYSATCEGREERFMFGKTRKLFLHFKITTEGEHQGKKLFMAFNLPKNKKLALGSKYYKNWCLANNWQRPSRNCVMGTKTFMRKNFDVQVRTVEPKHNGKKMPQTFHYSVVDQLTQLNTGGTL